MCVCSNSLFTYRYHDKNKWWKVSRGTTLLSILIRGIIQKKQNKKTVLWRYGDGGNKITAFYLPIHRFLVVIFSGAKNGGGESNNGETNLTNSVLKE